MPQKEKKKEKTIGLWLTIFLIFLLGQLTQIILTNFLFSINKIPYPKFLTYNFIAIIGLMFLATILLIIYSNKKFPTAL
jgi:hypothetical protein